MIPSPTLPWYELARFRRSRLTRIALVAVSVVPLLYGALYIWANIDPTGHLDRVDAAIVNSDEMVEITDRDGNTQPVAIGRQLAGNLIGNDDKNNYDWHLTDSRDAAQGLADGRYKAVLYIPENLSKAATSTSGDPAEAIQGKLDLRTNDAVNYINGTIAHTILGAAKDALNAQVTETYLDNIYLGFSDIRLALGEAADGARQLGDGATDLADGAEQLDKGADQLAGGLSTLKSRTASLPGDTRRLADGARQVADGTGQLNSTVQQVTQAILGATSNANEDIDALAAQLDQIADACEADPPAGVDCSVLRDAAGRADELKAAVGGVRGEIETVRSQTQQLADGADQVADGNQALADGMPALANGIGQASDGASQLASGTGDLTDGARQLADGAYQLQSGLTDGSKDVPDYDEDEREQLAKTAATPVQDAAERLNAVDGYGTALAPYFMALALWVGAMAIYLLLRPLSARAIASTAGSVRTALAGLAPGLAISAVQALLLVGVVVGVLNVHAERPVLMIATALAAGIVFTALNQMFIALFGAAGRFLAIVFVCLQLTSAGGTYPIETSPGFFNLLHSLMPMTYVVDLFRAATAGGGHAVTQDFAVLAVFTLAALAVTSLAAYRRQRVTISRLHPTLVV